MMLFVLYILPTCIPLSKNIQNYKLLSFHIVLLMYCIQFILQILQNIFKEMSITSCPLSFSLIRSLTFLFKFFVRFCITVLVIVIISYYTRNQTFSLLNVIYVIILLKHQLYCTVNSFWSVSVNYSYAVIEWSDFSLNSIRIKHKILLL